MNNACAVVLPGTMGSILKLGDETVWPGRLTELIFPYNRLDQLMSDDLEPAGLIRRYAISVQYDSLVALLNRCGFQEDENLHLFAYDWRKPNEDAAARLARLLDSVAAANPDRPIHLIGHSMGGLIARHYLESGLYCRRPAFPQIRSLIALATPHRGSPLALTAALGRDRKLFLRAPQVRRLAADPRFPSVYQLLPPWQEPFIWDSELDPVSLYDSDLPLRLQLSLDNLAAAAAFHHSLDSESRPSHVRYFFFCGTRVATLAGIRAGKNSTDFDTICTDDSGDGTVPTWSSHLAGIQHRFTGGEHSEIYKNPDLRRTLASLLGYQGNLDAEERVEVCVRESVVEPESRVSLSVAVASGVTRLDGSIDMERIDCDDDGSSESVPLGRPSSLRYEGAPAERFQLALAAPEYPGLYRLKFVAPSGRVLGEDEFFVQLPGPDAA